MRNRVAIWAALVAVGFIALAFLLPPIPPPKARASRVSGVNNVRSVTLTLTPTNAPPSAQPGLGK